MLNHSSKWVTQYIACFEHSDLFTVVPIGPIGPYGLKERAIIITYPMADANSADPFASVRDRGAVLIHPIATIRDRLCMNRMIRSITITLWFTTGVLTTTVLIYTFRAGITAGAGTRLFLQLLLMERFNLSPISNHQIGTFPPLV